VPDFERSATIQADADALFRYLSDVGNLPRYFSRMTDAEPAGSEAVHVTAVIDDENDGSTDGGTGGEERTVEGEAWFRVDEDARTIAWGSEGPNEYRGELEVSGNGGSSEVAVRRQTKRGASDEIEQELETTLANVKRLVEGG